MKHFAAVVLALLACLATLAVLFGAAPGQPAGPRPRIVTETIAYEHGDAKLEGFFVYDANRPGRRPGILLTHEWWGHNEFARQQARRFAEAGYAVFALDMYGKGVKGDTPAAAGKLAEPFGKDRNLTRARALAGLEVLAQKVQVNPEQIVALGYCFGGMVSLELARSGAPIKAAISLHGNPAPLSGFESKFNKDVAILVLHGDADPLVPRAALDAFTREMGENSVDFQFIAYGGAVHAFTNKDADKVGIDGVRYDAKADRRSFDHVKLLMEQLFGPLPRR